MTSATRGWRSRKGGEGGAGHQQRLDRLERGHGGGARLSVDRRHLAEKVARTADRDDHLAAGRAERGHLGAAGQQHDHGSSLVALMEERDVAAVRALAPDGPQVLGLGLRERVEEGVGHAMRGRALHGRPRRRDTHRPLGRKPKPARWTGSRSIRYTRSLPRAGVGADHLRMTEVARITDADPASLAARVQAAAAALGEGLVVSTFTLWYTTRPPVHHAILKLPTAP